MTEQKHIPQPRDIDRARTLRRDSTTPERLLWSMLRGRRLGGFKFRRQAPMLGYVVDFYCQEARLAVELDGMTHDGNAAADEQRSARLRRHGLKVMRFTNDEVLEDVAVVAEAILRAARERLSDVPSPQPSPGGRGGKRT